MVVVAAEDGGGGSGHGSMVAVVTEDGGGGLFVCGWRPCRFYSFGGWGCWYVGIRGTWEVSSEGERLCLLTCG